MTYSASRYFALVLSASVMGLAVLTPAQAGFEWKGPIAPPAPPAAAAPAQSGTSAVPADPMSDLAPVITWDGSGSPTAGMPAVRPGPVETSPVTSFTSSPAQGTVPVTDMSAPDTASQGPALEGFGNDVPLAIALQQIAPAGYRFSFGAGVNPGTNVSWKGGKPWEQVLQDTLSANDLSYIAADSTITVTQGARAPVSAVTAQETERTLLARATETRVVARAPKITSVPAAPETTTIRRSKAKDFLGRLNFFSEGFGRDKEVSKFERTSATTSTPAPAPAYVPTPTPAQPAPVVPSPAAKFDAAVSADPLPQPVPDVRQETRVVSKPYSGYAAPVAPAAGVPSAWMRGQDTQHPAQDHAPVPLRPLDEADIDAVPPVAEALPVPPAAEQPVSLVRSVAADTPAAPSKPADAQWTAQRGRMLRDVLKQWSDKAGFELYWSIDYDYKLKNDIALPGTYEAAVGALLDQFKSAQPQPYGQLHKAESGRVLIIKAYDTAG
jgi:Toxin co-regulated pilus biosynthesis protein Q